MDGVAVAQGRGRLVVGGGRSSAAGGVRRGGHVPAPELRAELRRLRRILHAPLASLGLGAGRHKTRRLRLDGGSHRAGRRRHHLLRPSILPPSSSFFFFFATFHLPFFPFACSRSFLCPARKLNNSPVNPSFRCSITTTSNLLFHGCFLPGLTTNRRSTGLFSDFQALIHI